MVEQRGGCPHATGHPPPPSAAPLEILPSQQPEPRAVETWVVTPVDHSRGESLESPHGVEVYRDVAAGDLIEQRPVVNGVAGEQGFAARFPQTHAAGRMPG